MISKQLQSRIREHIKAIIEDEPIAFDWLVSDSEEFNLSEESFYEYLRQFLEILLKKGGMVVIGGKGTAYDWIETRDFGTTPTEISINLLKELHNTIDDKEYLFTYGVWFAIPDKYPELIKRLSI